MRRQRDDAAPVDPGFLKKEFRNDTKRRSSGRLARSAPFVAYTPQDASLARRLAGFGMTRNTPVAYSFDAGSTHLRAPSSRILTASSGVRGKPSVTITTS